MNRFIIGVLTLGLAPLFRMLFSKGASDPVRYHAFRIWLSKFGNPSETVLRKILRKYYESEDMLERSFEDLKSGYYAYCRDAKEAAAILDEMKRKGFVFDHVTQTDHEPLIFIQGMFQPLSVFDLCKDCGTNEVCSIDEECNACGSQNVIIAEDLSSKELKKHVETYSEAATTARKNRRSNPRRNDDDDDEDGVSINWLR